MIPNEYITAKSQTCVTLGKIRMLSGLSETSFATAGHSANRTAITRARSQGRVRRPGRGLKLASFATRRPIG